MRKQEALDTKVTYVLNRNVEHSASLVDERLSHTSTGFKLSLKDSGRIDQFNLKFNASMPEDSLLMGVDRSVVDHFVPFPANVWTAY